MNSGPIFAAWRALWRSLILLVACALAPSARSAPILHFSTFLAGDPGPAICERVLRRAYQQLGVGVVVDGFPAARSLLWANSGQADGELCRMQGIDLIYTNLVRVPLPIHFFEVVAFGWQREVDIRRWSDLRPYRLGVIIGMVNEENKTRGYRVEPVPSIEQALRKLALHRTDYVIVNRVTGLFWMRQLGLQGEFTVSVPLERLELYHYLHLKHAALVGPLSAVLQGMARHGEIQAIRQAVLTEYGIAAPVPAPLSER